MWVLLPLTLGAVALLSGCHSSSKEKEIKPVPEQKPAAPSPSPVFQKLSDRELFQRLFPRTRLGSLMIQNPLTKSCSRFTFPFKPVFEDEPDFPGSKIRLGIPFHHEDEAGFRSHPLEFLTAGALSLVYKETLSRKSMYHYSVDGSFYEKGPFHLLFSKGRSLKIPFYTPRKDGNTCMAEEDFSNEKIESFDSPLCLEFEAPHSSLSETLPALSIKSGSDCDNRESKKLTLEATLLLK